MTITHRSQSETGIQRDAWVEINLAALERNFKKLKELTNTPVMAIVKADAYGHGATTIAPILQSMKADSFGVATVDEGISLRNAHITLPILILGSTPNWSYKSCIANDLTITIHSSEQINQLQDFCSNSGLRTKIQIKLDTGMNRLGVNPNELDKIIDIVLSSDLLELTGIYTHLSDSKDYDFSMKQKERFDNAIKKYKELKIQTHIANSYAAINYPEFRYSLVRLGIGLYGQEFNFLEPIISLKGRVTQIHEILKGESVSYDRTWIAENNALIATVPIGYADGIDRNLSNKINALYKNKAIKQVGTITMDQMMFDISNVNNSSENLKVGDSITLLNKDLPISSWAKILNTITFELVCRLKMRLPRIYSRD